jgi:hypothetical protein
MSRTVGFLLAIVSLLLGLYFGWIVTPPWKKGLHPGAGLATPPPVTCATTFFGPDDFKGTWHPTPIPAASGAQSTYDGAIAVSNLDRNVVAQVLPAGWTLANPNSSVNCHPVLILFGHQNDLHLFPPALEGAINLGPVAGYTEMMVLVPFVQRATLGQAMHTFVVHMLLNNQDAVTIGNEQYGYAKELGAFWDSPPYFAATRQGDTDPAFLATVLNAGTWSVFGSTTIPNLDQITKILSMPLIGIRTFGGISFDTCSYFEFDYANKPASVRPIDVQYSFAKPFATGMTSWPSFGTVKTAPDRAVQIKDVVWRIQWPNSGACLYF